jgi:hypothetical protein
MSDTQMIEERLRSFGAAPDEPDWPDVLRRAGETPRPAAGRFSRRRLVLVLAACVAVAAPAVALSGVLSSGSSRPTSEPPQFSPINLDFTRGSQGVTSIDVTINAATLGGTALLQVVRSQFDQAPGAPPGEPATTGQVVFQEQVPMTNIASPTSGPPGTQALSTWSGTLSPSGWDGGCQKAPYWLTVKVSPAHPTIEAQGEWAQSGWFVCSSG